VVTGKSIAAEGIPGRDTATALGCLFAAREAFAARGRSTAGASIAIQGFGNAGSNFAVLSSSILTGSRVVAVSDSRGAVYAADGLDVRGLCEHKRATGSVVGFPGATALSAGELLSLDVTLLVPAALGGQITAATAGTLRAVIVAEAANGPTLPEADVVLAGRGVLVVPDVLANAGGVTASWFEMLQAAAGRPWTRAELDRRLEERMTKAFGDVLAASRRYGTDLRTAAYVVAVERVALALPPLDA
jgi:glutamate dehydrogenase/leucine dehydrogenase